MNDRLLWAARHIRLKQCREGAFIYDINDVYIGQTLENTVKSHTERSIT